MYNLLEVDKDINKLPNLTQFIEPLEAIITTITFNGKTYSNQKIKSSIDNIISMIKKWQSNTIIQKSTTENIVLQESINLIEEIKVTLNSGKLTKDDLLNAFKLHNLLIDV